MESLGMCLSWQSDSRMSKSMTLTMLQMKDRFGTITNLRQGYLEDNLQTSSTSWELPRNANSQVPKLGLLNQNWWGWTQVSVFPQTLQVILVLTDHRFS